MPPRGTTGGTAPGRCHHGVGIRAYGFIHPEIIPERHIDDDEIDGGSHKCDVF